MIGKAPVDLFSLTGKTALVTGAGGLLGARFCETLAKSGANVVAADANLKKVGELAARLQAQDLHVEAFKVDVTDLDSVSNMVAFTQKIFGQPTVLVCSAALDPKFDAAHYHDHHEGYEQYPLSAWRASLDVNLTGLFLCTQKAAGGMKDAGGGSIILISSIYGIVAPDQRLYQRDGNANFFKPPDYAVTKAGVLGLTRYLAAYYANQSIRVNALSPGGVYHDHDEEFAVRYAQHTMLGRMMRLNELDGAVLFLASEASSYMTGANLVVDGGWTAW